MIKKYNLEEQCIISSFNPFVLYRIKKIMSNINTAFLWSKRPEFILNSPLWVWMCRPDGFHVDICFLDNKLIKWIRKKNMSVIVYTVNNKPNLNKSIELEVNGVITDNPEI